MRPVVGASSEPASARKPSISGETPTTTGLGISSNGLTSFMLASESDLDQHEIPAESIGDSTYGIRSIDDDTGGPAEDEQETGAAGALKPSPRGTALRMLDTRVWNDGAGPSRSPDVHPPVPPDGISQPLTPISFASHAFESSVPSSPKSLSMRSFRHSDDDMDGSSSNAIASSEDEGEPALSVPAPEASPQQLIMPSLIMPSRRPFTERGRALGRLKLMVAGSSSVGKTSLIKSLIQTCEDLVHVDAASLQPLQTLSKPRVPRGVPTTKPTSRVTEIHASTKAHPEWWTEADGSNILQRRRSIDENVLGRNICFIDTPGFDRGTSILEGMEPALKYLESQIRKSISPQEQTDSELLGMLSGYGGSQVDVVLYLLDHDLKPADTEYIRQLNQLSNVIPLLAKADTLDDATIADLKCAAVATLSSSSISLLSLPNNTSNGPTPPFTVCSCPSNDLDAMDASVLMQSECIQSLHQSDLPRLIDVLFEPSNANYFKHAAASKALAFRSSQRSPPHISPLLTSLSTTSAAHPSTHSSLVTTRPLQNSGIQRPSGSEQQAHDPRVAQLRLAAWASSLQRSLTHERRRYERLARGERLAWLRAQLDAYDDIDVPDPIGSAASVVRKESGALLPLKREAASRNSRIGSRDTADPLGIVRFRDKARHTTWLALQVAGGCGVLSAAVVWALHRWGAFNGGVIAVSNGSGNVREWSWSWWPFNEEEGVLERLWTWLG